MSKYLLCCTLQQEEKQHLEITKNLSKFFELKPLHNFIKPHITLIPPFEIVDTDMLYDILNDLEFLFEKYKRFELKKNGFIELSGEKHELSFGWKYTLKNPSTKTIISKVIDLLGDRYGIKISKDSNGVCNNLHATLIKEIEDAELYVKCRSYIEFHYPKTVSSLVVDKIYLFVKDGRNRWLVQHVFRLKSS